MASPGSVLFLVLALALFALCSSSDGTTLTYKLPVGATCHPNSYQKCDHGLTCEGEKCKINDNGSCKSNPTSCLSGRVCVGTSSTKRCKIPMGPGQRCERDPFWVCRSSLTCVHNICKIGLGAVCTDYPDECASGLSCVGSGSVKRCNKLMDIGGQCEVDPWWVCRPGLVCQNQECKIPQGGVCTANPDECASGLACVGSGSAKRCNKPMGPGGQCEVDPYWVCEPGLTCAHKRCKIPENGSCTGNTDQCVSSLACVGTSSNKRCKKLMDVGERCGVDPFWVCKPSLPCQGNVCRIPQDGSCTNQEDLCEEGTNCIGKDHDYRCKAPVGLGGSCGNDVFSVCEEKLACDKRSWKCIDNGYDCKYSGKGCPDW